MKTETPKETKRLLKQYKQIVKRRWKQKEANWRENPIRFPLIKSLAADPIYTNNRNRLLGRPYIKEEDDHYLY